MPLLCDDSRAMYRTSVRWSPLKSPNAIWCVCSLQGSCACAADEAISSTSAARNLNCLLGMFKISKINRPPSAIEDLLIHPDLVDHQVTVRNREHLHGHCRAASLCGE